MYWKNYCMSSFVSSKSSRYNFADEDIFCPYTFTEFRGIIHISFFISNTHATRIPSVNFSITLWNFCYSLRSLSYLPRLEHCYSCKLRKPLTNLPFTFCIPNEDICITLLKNFIICFYRQQNFAIDRYFKPFLNLQKEVNVNSSFEALYLKGVKLDRWILFMKSLLHIEITTLIYNSRFKNVTKLLKLFDGKVLYLDI